MADSFIDPADVPVGFQMGLHPRQWGGMLTPDSRLHAAKFRRGLIYWIMEEGLRRGYWSVGSTVIDPTCGVGCGGIAAADSGLAWTGVDIDESFIATAHANLRLHESRWRAAGTTLPDLFEFDSRELAELFMDPFDCAIFSPPYGGRVDDHGTNKPGYENGETLGSYGSLTAAEGQVGVMRAHAKNAVTEGYWAMCRAIYEQVWRVVKPGGVVALVIKDYLRDGQVVPVCDQTVTLMQQCGFIPLERTYCMMANIGKDGQTRWNKGQFRSTTEALGGPRIDYEQVVWLLRGEG